MTHVPNPIRDKATAYALQSIDVYKKLIYERKEYVLSKQFLRSSTSAGANIEEAQRPHGRKDFLAKMEVALKEAYETRYWIRLLHYGKFIYEGESTALSASLEEVIRILSVIVARCRKNLKTK